MKITAMQTGSVLGDLMEALAPAQNAVPAEVGAFGAVLEEATQVLQANVPKEVPAAPATAAVKQEVPVLAGEVAPVVLEQFPVMALQEVPAETVLPEVVVSVAVPVAEESVEMPVGKTVAPAEAEVPLPRMAKAHGPQMQQEEVIPADVEPAAAEVLPVVGHAGAQKTETEQVKAEPETEEDAPRAEAGKPEEHADLRQAFVAPQVAVAVVVPVEVAVPETAGEEAAPVANGTADRAAAAYASLQKVTQHVAANAPVPVVEQPVTAAPEAETEAVKPAVARAEVVKPEMVKAEAVKLEGTRAEIVKPEAVKAEVVKPETVRAEVVKPETAKTAEVANAEAPRAEVVRPEAAKAEVIKPETVKAEVVQPKPIVAEIPRHETAEVSAETKPEEAPLPSRFQVAQGVAGYREQTFSGLGRKVEAPQDVAQAAAPEAVVVAAESEAVPAVSIEKPVETTATVPETPVVHLASAKPAERQQVAMPAETKPVVEPKVVPEPAPQAEVTAAAEVQPEEAAREPQKTVVAGGQQTLRQEAAANRTEPAKAEHPEGETVAKPVFEAAVRPRAAAANTGGKEQHFAAGDEKPKHAEATRQPDELRMQAPFQVAQPAQAQELQEVAQNPVHESILTQVREKLETEVPKKNGEITVRLNPEELGELTISVKMDGRSVKVEVTAETATAKQALMENIDRLKETFAKQNLTMEQFDVSTGSGGRFQQAQREGRSPYSNGGWFGGYSPKQEAPVIEQQKVAAYYKPRENSLIDVRF